MHWTILLQEEAIGMNHKVIAHSVGTTQLLRCAVGGFTLDAGEDDLLRRVVACAQEQYQEYQTKCFSQWFNVQ